MKLYAAFLPVVFVATTSVRALGQGTSSPLASTACTRKDLCPRPTEGDIKFLCSNIGSRSKDEAEDSRFFYLYEKTLWQMSGARADVDTEDMAKRKVRLMWDLHHDALACDAPGLRNGNLLKYGVYNYFIHFIKELAIDYQLNLNFIDPSDNRTVLDYTRDMLTDLRGRNINNAAQVEELQYVFDVLRKAGAKFSAELSSRDK